MFLKMTEPRDIRSLKLPKFSIKTLCLDYIDIFKDLNLQLFADKVFLVKL